MLLMQAQSITFQVKLLIHDSCLVVSYSVENNNWHIGLKCHMVWDTYTVVYNIDNHSAC
jgi:type III secretory pathway component EscS